MKIEISIWGIRRGFEKEGFFHTHNNAAIKASQQDRFRNICNNIGNKGFFNIQHIQGKTIVSYIDSGVREYLPTGPRPGYAVFSLIIPSQDVFEQSPRAVLLELAHFYRSRVGESNQNNFNSAEIEYFLNKLKLVPAQNLHIREQVSAYAYYADAAQIDHFLTGNIPFAAFGELLFIPSDYNPSTGKYKEIEFIDDSLRSKPDLIDLRQAEAQFLRERENEIAKLREEEKRKNELQQQRQFLEQDLINMLKLGKKEEALQKFEQSPLRSYINPAIAHQLNQFKQEQEVQNKSALLQQQDERLVSELLTAHRKGDMDLALANYKKLSSKNHANLTQDITRKLEQYDADSKQLREAEEQKRVKEREEDGKRAKRKKNGVYFILLAMVALIATSYFLKQPTFIWDNDADGVYNWSDVCPNKKGSAKFDGCPQKPKEHKKKNLNENNVDTKDETPLNETISNQKNAIWNNLNAGQEIHLTRDKNADLFQLLRKGVIFLKYENNKFWFDVRTAGKSKWIELENENTEKIRVFFNIELDDINPQNNNNIKETTKVSSNTTNGGMNKKGDGKTVNTSTKNGTKTYLEFSQTKINEAYALWEKIKKSENVSENKSKLKKIIYEYNQFTGNTNQNKETETFTNFIKICNKTMDNY